MVIGLISDTHGLMRDQALDALAGSTLILHAGDIGGIAVLEALRSIAPVVAVLGNNDVGAWALPLAEREHIERDGIRVELLHDLKTWSGGAEPPPQIVVSGHTHRPKIETRHGILHVNPGSAGPRRFRLPISVARLHIENRQAQAELLTLG